MVTGTFVHNFCKPTQLECLFLDYIITRPCPLAFEFIKHILLHSLKSLSRLENLVCLFTSFKSCLIFSIVILVVQSTIEKRDMTFECQGHLLQ